MSSIRVRTTAIAVVTVAVALLASAVALVAWQRQSLTDALDARLADRASAIETLLTAGRTPPLLGGSSVEGFVQVVDDSGSVVTATDGLTAEPLPLPVSASAETYRTVASLPVDDDAFRVLTRPLDGGTLYVGSTYDVVHESTAALLQALALTLPFVLVVVAVLVWWLVGRTLRPVEAIRAEVAEISGDQLGRRVPLPASDDEISLLARTMNQMLDRLQHADQRQRQFTGDAAHELRSPLARIRAELEVERGRGGSAAQSFEVVLDDVRGMERLVDDLLYLARADAGAMPATAPLDLDDVVLREVTRCAAEGGVTIDATGVSGAHVLGNASMLARLVRNLLDNASTHAASSVSVSLVEREGCAVLTVADDGPGLPDDDRERVFQRFTRVDEARSTRMGGTGLGLAIARSIAEQHGGRLVALPSATGGVFELTLPTTDEVREGLT